MNEQIREAVKITHEYGCIKAMAGGEENQPLIDAWQTLLSLAQQYLSVKGLPEEKKNRKVAYRVDQAISGEFVDDLEIKGFNQALHECKLSLIKSVPSVQEIEKVLLQFGGDYVTDKATALRKSYLEKLGIKEPK